MRKIGITLSKGGVGKTTTSINLAAALAQLGRTVAVIDTDTQGQAGDALGISADNGLAELLLGECTLSEALVEARDNLYLLSGGTNLAAAKLAIAKREMMPHMVMTEALEPLEGELDYIIIDSAPSWDSLTMNLLFYAKEILAPVLLEGLAIKGLIQFVERLTDVQKYHAIEMKYILPTMLDKRVKQSAELLAQLTEHFGDLLLEPIPLSVRLSECAMHGETIFEYAAGSTGAKAYMKLAERIAADDS